MGAPLTGIDPEFVMRTLRGMGMCGATVDDDGNPDPLADRACILPADHQGPHGRSSDRDPATAELTDDEIAHLERCAFNSTTNYGFRERAMITRLCAEIRNRRRQR